MRTEGVTASERYLQKLCDNSFLSLWSYSGIFRDQGKSHQQKTGKEVCDLLVVFSNHIVIFSDKHCEFPNTGNLDVDWSRWHGRAIEKSANQIWGAERWIREHPDRLFLDKECNQPFPIPIPDLSKAAFHRVVVAHGASEHCIEFFHGGSGSLMIDSTPVGKEHYKPFTVGQVNPQKGFVHILDDTTLDIIVSTLDTINDFTDYLMRKERFFSLHNVFVAGEEDLLALYLQRLGGDKGHDFVIDKKLDSLFIDEGVWEQFVQSPERKSQIEANKISYAWDALIEKFTGHAIANTQYHTTKSSLHDTEIILRFMASENRLRRRILAQALTEIVATTPKEFRFTRIMPPSRPGEPHYVFLLFPHLAGISEHQYREDRLIFLGACCRLTKLRYPAALDIVGIATESGLKENGYGSEDAVYFDARSWNDEMQNEAIRIQRETGLLTNVHSTFDTELEYPSEKSKLQSRGFRREKFVMKGRERNQPCICGSGRKFKHCCGKK